MTLHFVHIGKTGGSAIKYALRTSGWACGVHEYLQKAPELPETPYGHVVLHKHVFRLRELEPEDYVFFSLRDPIARFVSGFYSRLRKGQPRLYVEWKPGERAAFERFSTPDELALGLASDDPDVRRVARRGMRKVKHLGHVSGYLGSEADLRAKLPRVVYIARQETLAEDWRQLKEVLGLPAGLKLPTDAVESHRSDRPNAPLGERATEILREWYAEDYRLLDLCEAIRADNGWGVADAEPRIRVPPPAPERRAQTPGDLPSGEVGRIARAASGRSAFWTRFLRRTSVRTAAEIGVADGELARRILDACPALETYYMIDSWGRPDGPSAPGDAVDGSAAVFDAALAATQAHHGKRVVLRGPTTEVVDEIPDSSLDFAYVGGDHTLRGIVIDLVRVYPKVREGGWIGGGAFSRSIWQQGRRSEPTLVFPFAVHFAEAVGARIFGLPHRQFLLRKRSGGSFEFVDLTRRYRSTDLLDQVAPRRKRAGRRPVRRGRDRLRRLTRGRP